MITRAYTNADGQRQEVALSAEQWEALTEADLENILGFKKAAPAPEPVQVTTVKATTKKKK